MLNCFSYSTIKCQTFQKGTVPAVTEIVVTMYVRLFQLFQDIVSNIPIGDTEIVVTMYVELFQLFQDIVPHIPIGDCASGHRDCCNYVC